MTCLSASERLQQKIGVAHHGLRRAASRIWASPRVAELYPEYLATMHAVVRTSVPLMEAALGRAEELAGEDDVAVGVAAYLAVHVHEEAGHDRWLLEDLEALDIDPEWALRRMPSPRIAAAVGAQYYWLRHYHPVSLLGHAAVMEGYPPTPGFAGLLEERTGHPAEAFRSIRRHARLDIRHREELYEAIDRLPLRPEDEAIVGVSALHTVDQMIGVFEELVERAGDRPEGARR